MDRNALARLLDDQFGVIDRAQLLGLGAKPHDIARMLRRKDLAAAVPGVYVNHTGERSWLQRAMIGVLACWPAALADESAVRAACGPGYRFIGADIIHVVIERDRKLVAPPGVHIHRSTRFAEQVQWQLNPPRLKYEEAVLDLAVSQSTDLEALGVLANACASRRTTARRLIIGIADRPKLPRRAWLISVLTDVAEGASSVLEHAYLTRVERAHRFPTADRQVKARTRPGVIYRDTEYSFGSRALVVELDGRLFHDSVAARDRDFDRDLDATVDGRTTVRLSYGQVLERPCETASRIAILLKARGWVDEPVACSPHCDVGLRSIRSTR